MHKKIKYIINTTKPVCTYTLLYCLVFFIILACSMLKKKKPMSWCLVTWKFGQVEQASRLKYTVSWTQSFQWKSPVLLAIFIPNHLVNECTWFTEELKTFLGLIIVNSQLSFVLKSTWSLLLPDNFYIAPSVACSREEKSRGEVAGPVWDAAARGPQPLQLLT